VHYKIAVKKTKKNEADKKKKKNNPETKRTSTHARIRKQCVFIVSHFHSKKKSARGKKKDGKTNEEEKRNTKNTNT
jgi:hypothetical protein